MSAEDRLFEQRVQKIRDIEKLGFEPYPRKFDFTHSLAQVRDAYDAAEGEELEEQKPTVRVCGRLATIRRQGRAGFCHIAQEGVKLQVYVRQDAVGKTLFGVLQKARRRRHHRRRGLYVPHPNRRADRPRRKTRISRQGHSADAREVARPPERRNALSPALPRLDRQSRRAACLLAAQQDDLGAQKHARASQLRRG